MGYTESQLRSHILELQTYLHTISICNAEIPRILPDGIYGAETAAAVKAFQCNHHLAATGETNRTTWNAVVREYRILSEPPLGLSIFPEAVGSILKEGDAGLAVLVAQSMLKVVSVRFVNFPELKITGIYDPQTIRAVQLFRRMAALPDGDWIDKKAWNQLVTSTATFNDIHRPMDA